MMQVGVVEVWISDYLKSFESGPVNPDRGSAARYYRLAMLDLEHWVFWAKSKGWRVDTIQDEAHQGWYLVFVPVGHWKRVVRERARIHVRNEKNGQTSVRQPEQCDDSGAAPKRAIESPRNP